MNIFQFLINKSCIKLFYGIGILHQAEWAVRHSNDKSTSALFKRHLFDSLVRLLRL